MLIVGPVRLHQGDYTFDVWTADLGRKPGFPYRRIEDAYYARNFEIAGKHRNGRVDAIACDTLADFMAEIAALATPPIPVGP